MLSLVIIVVMLSGCHSRGSQVATRAETIGSFETQPQAESNSEEESTAASTRLVSYQQQVSDDAGEAVRLEDAADGGMPTADDSVPAADAETSGSVDREVETETETDDETGGDGEADDARSIPTTLPSPTDPPMPLETTDAPMNALSLEQVLQSVFECYPEIEIAIGELETASGKILASWGEFDTVATAHSISQPMGFYRTYRNGTGISRPLYGGGEVYGTYRIGDGFFEPWFGERETNEGGEFKAGFSLPLLKDRLIDARRTAVGVSRLQRDQLESNVESRLLQFERFATQAYWDWVASGQALQIQEQLLKLAETRVDQIDKRMEAGDLAAIAGIDNDRFIAKRKSGMIKARRGLEKAAIKLSVFLRDQSCQPVIADESLLPSTFPIALQLADFKIDMDINTAIRTRPEVMELDSARQQACLERRYAYNLLLPKLDVKGFAGQDVGGETSSTGDKTPFELQLGVFAEVPIQRREGAGKVQAANGKLAQIDAKRQLVVDKLRAGIQDAASAVNNAAQQIEQSRENVRLTEESLRLGRLAFDEGDIDLLLLNIYESSVADARLELLEAQFKYFASLAQYETLVRPTAFDGESSTLPQEMPVVNVAP